MNILLQFRSKRHSESYSQDLKLQAQKRMIMLSAQAAIYIVINIISYSLYPSATPLNSKMLVFARGMTTILMIIGTWLINRNARRLQQYAVLISIILDVVLGFIPFSFYPAVGTISVDIFSKLGVYVWAWSACTLAISLYFMISNWWVKFAVMVLQIGYFLVFVGETEPYAVQVILMAVEGILFYFSMAYFHEKYQRLDFYDKRKIYDNYEAIKKIFDDISQGIMIVDKKNEIIYSNQAVDRLFNEKTPEKEISSSLTTLFSQVRVKSMFPHIESLFNEQILSTRQDERGFISTINELLEGVKKLLFDENLTHNSVIFETVLNSEHKSTNLSIKFTKSLFMEKQVLVVNITDNTDRDLLIAANASNEYKSRLLSSVSHELRTPLNGSINFTEQALDETTLPTEIKEKWLVPALRSNQLLLSLVNDILDFSQMHAGKLRLVHESKNVVDTAKECIDLVELQAKKKKLNLELHNNLPLSEEILMTDHNRLKQIMLNLLSNAVKFTFKGSVTLVLDSISSSSSPRTTHQLKPPISPWRLSVSSIKSNFSKGVRITVKDTGIGINSENQKKLFQAFEKLELGNNPLTINSTGAGLGLVISNNLVQRLSPKGLTREDCEVIKFHSEEDVGSTFYFEAYNHEKKSREAVEALNEKNELSVRSDTGLGLLCLEELKREVSHKRNNLHSQTMNSLSPMLSPEIQMPTRQGSDQYSEIKTLIKTCKCPKILIVDDDTFNLTALDMILSKLSLTCDWALNGKEAVDKIKTRQMSRCSKICQQYRLMFLDCQMPILNGFETAKLLKRMMNDGEIDRLRIVGCTAFVQEADEKKARQAGMDDFCTKPINTKMIKEKVDANLK